MALTGWDDPFDSPVPGAKTIYGGDPPPDSSLDPSSSPTSDQSGPPNCPPGTHAEKVRDTPNQDTGGGGFEWQCVPDAGKPPPKWTDSGKPDCPGGQARYVGPYDSEGNAIGGESPSHWECVKGGSGGSGSGSSGGAGAPTQVAPDISGFMQPDLGVAALYGQRSPLEERALQAVTALAEMMGGGAEAYNEALRYWQGILQGDTSAIMPTLEDMSELSRGAESKLERSGVRGGIKDLAISELDRTKFGQMNQAIQRLRPEAASQLGQLGLAGAGLSADAFMGVAGHERGRLQGAFELEQRNRQLAANTALAAAGLEQTERLTMRQLDIQESLGFAGLALQEALGFARLDLDRLLGFESLDLQRETFDWQRLFSQQTLDFEKDKAQGQKWSSILGSLFGTAGTVIGAQG